MKEGRQGVVAAAGSSIVTHEPCPGPPLTKDAMPFRSKETLEQWVSEFQAAREAGDLVRVLIQDGADGGDTGLVVVPLHNSTVSVFMEPIEIGDARWRVTLEPQPDFTIVSSFQLHALASELSVAAELCAYLEARSVGHEEDDAE